MLTRFSHVQLYVTVWTAAHQGSSVHRILQARILEWVAISFSILLINFQINNNFSGNLQSATGIPYVSHMHTEAYFPVGGKW